MFCLITSDDQTISTVITMSHVACMLACMLPENIELGTYFGPERYGWWRARKWSPSAVRHGATYRRQPTPPRDVTGCWSAVQW